MSYQEVSDSIDAVMALESGVIGELETAKALQVIINSGLVWSLQGSYGRAAMQALESGRNMLGVKPERDAYGNRVPSRDEVKEGSKGSESLVRESMGDEWADALLAIA